MKRIFSCSNLIAVAIVLLTTATTCAQSPRFPNTNPIYNNPFPAPSSNAYGPFYRGGPFVLRPLPAAYAQPLPAPPPSVMAQFGSVPYNYGARSNVSVYNSQATYPPPQNRNWAPSFSSR
jgi:hypothetical protein